jgi:LmbE family N-acetylglucosaminyl deacetylase
VNLKKIVIFSPHPDDELIGAGGSLLKWENQGKEVHIIYISDGRAAYSYERKHKNLIDTKETQISEEELAKVRLREIDQVAEFLEIPSSNIHKFKIPDQEVKGYKETAIERSRATVRDADRLVIPSNNNSHEDHQATFDIAVRTAQELNLQNIEFYVYAIYLGIEAPPDHQIRINIEEYNEKIYEALQLYESQKYIKTVKAVFEWKKKQKWERFGVFSMKDLGNFKNF